MNIERQIIANYLNGDAEKYLAWTRGENNAPTEISKYKLLESVALPIIKQLEMLGLENEEIKANKNLITNNESELEEIRKQLDEAIKYRRVQDEIVQNMESQLEANKNQLALIDKKDSFVKNAGAWITGITLAALIANLKHLVPGYLKLMPEHIKTGYHILDIVICVCVFLCMDAAIIIFIKAGQKKWALAYTIGTIILTLIGVIFSDFHYSREAFFIVSSLMFSGIIYCFASLSENK